MRDIVVHGPPEEQAHDGHRQPGQQADRHAGDQQRPHHHDRYHRDHGETHPVARVTTPVAEATGGDRPGRRGGHAFEPAQTRVRPGHPLTLRGGQHDADEPAPHECQSDQEGDRDQDLEGHLTPSAVGRIGRDAPCRTQRRPREHRGDPPQDREPARTPVDRRHDRQQRREQGEHSNEDDRRGLPHPPGRQGQGCHGARHPRRQHARRHDQHRRKYCEKGGGPSRTPRRDLRDREDHDEQRRDAHQSRDGESYREPRRLDAEEAEPTRVDGVIDPERQRQQKERQHHDRPEDDHHGAGDVGAREPQRHEADDDERGNTEAVGERDEHAQELGWASPERVAQQRQLQSEKLCNHSSPSTVSRPPASSTKRSSRVRPFRTAAMVPSASTEPSTITAT